MKTITLFLALIGTLHLAAQVNYGTPGDEPLPEILNGKRKIIQVVHFPKQNDPIQIDEKYYWMHATAIMCKESEIEIIEFGAYLFYNDKWNLRRSYPLKDLDKNFKTSKQRMSQAKPYVWIDNYRVDNSLFGGWALWYFIGTTSSGEVVCGYETIHTTDNLLNK